MPLLPRARSALLLALPGCASPALPEPAACCTEPGAGAGLATIRAMEFLRAWRRRLWPQRRPWVILDDFFPNLLTGFRVAEYNAYLQAFPQLRILSTLGDFAPRHAEYAALYPAHADRVAYFTEEALDGCAFAYLNFLNNAVLFLPHLERRRLPFVLTLYPGGGLGLNEPESDDKLRRVLSLPGLQAIITTQRVTADYLREFTARHGLRLPPLHPVTGVVVNPLYFAPDMPAHGAYFGEGKPTFDICFVAEKYMPRGENKGYPAFIAMAHALADLPHLRFHVVGSFTPEDIDVSALGERIRFHGRLETSQMRSFFTDKDLVVSPNKPWTLHPGNFDGFPTGSCVEASLCGVAMMASDVLQQDPGYAEAQAMLIVPPDDPERLAREVRALAADPARLARIARAGQALSRRLYAPEHQIGQRMRMLETAAAAVGLRLR
jgi:lipopolysaccharide transport system ATP-binding protein